MIFFKNGLKIHFSKKLAIEEGAEEKKGQALAALPVGPSSTGS
jgi:hypothetical protein